MKVSKQTRQLADRLQQVGPKPLTQRQAIRRAMWLQEQTCVPADVLTRVNTMKIFKQTRLSPAAGIAARRWG